MEEHKTDVMNRQEFSKSLLKAGLCTCAWMMFPSSGSGASSAPLHREPGSTSEDVDFIANWLNDLMDTMESTLDRETQVKLIEGCGRGCFNRHQFKKDIAEEGKGDLTNLMKAYDRNFETWKEETGVHIRYRKVSKQSYCPVANRRPVRENDIFCECTRSTHQAVLETALAKPVKVEILESLRRGGNHPAFRAMEACELKPV